MGLWGTDHTHLMHDNAAVHARVEGAAVVERALIRERYGVGSYGLRGAADGWIGERHIVQDRVRGPDPGHHAAAIQIHDRRVEREVLDVNGCEQPGGVAPAAAGVDADQPRAGATAQHDADGQSGGQPPPEYTSHTLSLQVVVAQEN